MPLAIRRFFKPVMQGKSCWWMHLCPSEDSPDAHFFYLVWSVSKWLNISCLHFIAHKFHLRRRQLDNRLLI
jgi:hypothetical protein